MLLPVPGPKSKPSDVRANNERCLVPANNAAADLIRNLSFKESLDLGKYADQAAESALRHARNVLPETGDFSSLSLNMLRSFCEQNTMLVGLNPNLSKRLQNGSAKWATKTGERYGELVDAAKPQLFAGKATEVGNGVKVARTAAMAATIIVEAAHLIASADMARMQRETIEKLDRLEAYHNIANQAKLQRLYCDAQDILNEPLDDDKRMKILDIRSDLHELRIKWWGEAVHNLSRIKDPRNEGYFRTILTGQESRDEKMIRTILNEVMRLALIEYTLRLDHALGLASETWSKSKRRISDELDELRNLSNILSEKCNYVSDARRGRVTYVNDTMASIPSLYEELLHPSGPIQGDIIQAIDRSFAQAC